MEYKDYWREFQKNTIDSYCILQLKATDETALKRYMRYQYLVDHGYKVVLEDYEATYDGAISTKEDVEDILDGLFTTFNTFHPADYIGRSLSVSDIIALKQKGKVTYYYVDSVGFVKLDL